jgi:hypothetical protein
MSKQTFGAPFLLFSEEIQLKLRSPSFSTRSCSKCTSLDSHPHPTYDLTIRHPSLEKLHDETETELATQSF